MNVARTSPTMICPEWCTSHHASEQFKNHPDDDVPLGWHEHRIQVGSSDLTVNIEQDLWAVSHSGDIATAEPKVWFEAADMNAAECREFAIAMNKATGILDWITSEMSAQ